MIRKHYQRTLFIVLAVAIVSVLFSSCGTVADRTYGEEREIIFRKVTATGGEGKLYILGSIHSADESAYPMPASVMQAYEESTVLAVEADLIAFEGDPVMRSECTELLMYRDRTKIQEHLSAELYEKAKNALKKMGDYTYSHDYMKTVVWNSILEVDISESVGLTDEYGVDRYFLRLAYEDDKRIYEIESMKLQYQMLADFSDELTELMLKENLENREAQEEGMKKLYSLWKSGDIEAFGEYVLFESENLSEREAALYSEYTDSILYSRNENMTDKAEELLKSGETCFYIVGAGHLPGEMGILSLLQQRGYSVSKTEGK